MLSQPASKYAHHSKPWYVFETPAWINAATTCRPSQVGVSSRVSSYQSQANLQTRPRSGEMVHRHVASKAWSRPLCGRTNPIHPRPDSLSPTDVASNSPTCDDAVRNDSMTQQTYLIPASYYHFETLPDLMSRIELDQCASSCPPPKLMHISNLASAISNAHHTATANHQHVRVGPKESLVNHTPSPAGPSPMDIASMGLPPVPWAHGSASDPSRGPTRRGGVRPLARPSNDRGEEANSMWEKHSETRTHLL